MKSLILMFLALLLWPATAAAHQTGQATFVVNIKPDVRQIDTLLAAPALDVAHSAQIDAGDDGVIDVDDLVRSWTSLGFYLDRHIDVTNDGKPCKAIEYKVSPKSQPQGFWFLKAFECDAPLGRVELKNDAMTETTGGYRHIGKIQLGDAVQTTVFNAQTPTFAIEVAKPEPPSVADTMKRFIHEGILHILFGWDHVLFVLALVLMSRRLRELLGVVTAFTIAHSVTLGLSALDIVTIPPRIVEPVIALSIAWVAAEAVLNRDDLKRAYIATFMLGLVHGFGFSYVLRDNVGLPTNALLPALFSFNVGVELGQLAIISLAYPLRKLIRNRPWERKVVITVASTISVVAMYWFIERTFAA